MMDQEGINIFQWKQLLKVSHYYSSGFMATQEDIIPRKGVKMMKRSAIRDGRTASGFIVKPRLHP